MYLTLEIYGDDPLSVINHLMLSNDNAYNAIDITGSSKGLVKWDSLEEDMVAFSKLYPLVTFVVYGEGEGKESEWRIFFKNGKYELQNAILTYPPEPIFNENQMKTLELFLQESYEDILAQYRASETDESLEEWLSDVYYPVYEEWLSEA
jgi:hypothetical protein